MFFHKPELLFFFISLTQLLLFRLSSEQHAANYGVNFKAENFKDMLTASLQKVW